MRATMRKRKFFPRRSGASGSALLVSLMVVMGLSMLGLAFVAISETESAISLNQRNSIQTQAIAEAGAKAAVEWFQDPVWAREEGIVPSNSAPPANMKRIRTIAGYSGVYKPLSTQFLFDKPYRPAPQHRFLGNEETADITINHTIDNTTMVNLNTYLFGSDSKVNGRISEILAYAPPMVGATLNPQGFWEDGERFGTATIKVTAEKWSAETGGTLLSRQVVRVIVGEFPLPVPGGPIQSASALDFGGSLDVYWGNETAMADLNPSVSRTRLPWLNPFERPHFERGYDDAVWPVLTTPSDNQNYFHELLGKRFLDPWAGARSRGANTACGTCGSYTNTAVEGQPVWAAFQNQVSTTYPTSKAVTFPNIDYNIWKKIALQGRGMKGLYYFKYSSPGKFRLNGTGAEQTMEYWVNNNSPGSQLGPGFYFFDTTSSANPQLVGGTTNAAILTTDEEWGASEIVGNFKMVGFIYMNVRKYRTTGGNNNPPIGQYNMPGEPYRDVGYRKVNPATGAWALDANGDYIIEGAGDGEWSFQDLDTATAGDVFDVVVDGPFTTTSFDPGANPHANQYMPKTWNPATCTVATDGGPYGANTCSDPHEPYLNMIYPEQNDPTATSPPGNANDGVLVGWEAEGSQTRRPRDLTGSTVPNCTDASNYDDCTSNKYDKDGALVDIRAMVHGVLYNEGDYSAQGGIEYFGAVLIRGGGMQVNMGAGGVEGNGSVKLWFDEKLIKEDWSPPGMLRVIIYSMQTDEN